MGRIFAIGDIHGCIDELNDLLDHIQPKKKDSLIFLGDLINSGPDSVGVLRRVQELDNSMCLLGNHELRLIQYHKTGKEAHLKPYDWDTIQALTEKDWAFLKTFKTKIHLPEYETLLVHGGLAPGEPWEEQSVETVSHIQVVDPITGQWGKRSQITNGISWSDYWTGPPFVVCGHTPRKEVFRRPWSLCIDTGCVYGGQLTAYEVTEKLLYQVNARQIYLKKALNH